MTTAFLWELAVVYLQQRPLRMCYLQCNTVAPGTVQIGEGRGVYLHFFRIVYTKPKFGQMDMECKQIHNSIPWQNKNYSRKLFGGGKYSGSAVFSLSAFTHSLSCVPKFPFKTNENIFRIGCKWIPKMRTPEVVPAENGKNRGR